MSASRKLFREFIDQRRILLLAALFAVLMTSALSAQIVETGVITGAVRDNTGAIIQAAHVSVRNDSTGLTTKTATDAQGIFVSPPLHPGDYSVEVEAPGFRAAVEHVRQEVGQRVSADVALTVGATAETVEVQRRTA